MIKTMQEKPSLAISVSIPLLKRLEPINFFQALDVLADNSRFSSSEVTVKVL